MAKKRRHQRSAHHQQSAAPRSPEPQQEAASEIEAQSTTDEMLMPEQAHLPTESHEAAAEEPSHETVEDADTEMESDTDVSGEAEEVVAAEEPEESTDTEEAEDTDEDTQTDEAEDNEPAEAEEAAEEPMAATAPASRFTRPNLSVPTFVQQRHFWYSVGAVVVIIFLALVLWWQWERSWVGIVNGRYITTTNLDEQLEASYGTQVLPQIVQQELILQEAAKKHVTPSKADVDKELGSFKSSVGGDEAYQSALKSYNVTEDILRDRIKVRLALEALLKDKLTVSDKEVQSYYDSNKDQIDPDNKGLDSVKQSIISTLKDQKLQQESDSYVSDLQKQYKVTTQISNSRMSFGDFLHDNIAQPVNDLWNGLTSLGKKK